MNNIVKKELLKQESSYLFCQLVEIEGENFNLNYINDNLELSVNNKTYNPGNFSFTPPDIESIDSNSQLEIEDIERVLIFYLQSTIKEVSVKIGLIERANPSVFIDGPYEYKISNIKISSSSVISIELKAFNSLNYKIGKFSYNNNSFPGLFG